ncbi:MFS transporter [Xanthomonas vasicola pv. arecae]|uniref:membrane protein n=1 Tax=Xanthomonas vasicola TaxID=56459 RepID=UPI00052CD7C8|nr:membrane protein [Xanthomonas vasicola]AZR27716.1 MFS transporter [Xanthomonas vasicola pv. arecae]
MSSPPHALPTALPPAALLAYAAAHFGKSLLWFTGELLLIFALTEHVGLSAVAAGFSVAGGLVVSAMMGLIAAQRWRADTNLARVGRTQWQGIALAAVTLSLVFVTPLLPPAARLISVLLLSLPFRAAYAVGDVAQNTLLGLARWPWRGARGVSAVRLIGSGLAALLVSAAIGLVLKAGDHNAASTALLIVALVSSIALLSAWWLRQTLQLHVHPIAEVSALIPAAQWQRAELLPLAVLATLTLALPTFTKLAPYLAQSQLGAAGWSSAVLISYAMGTMLVQPLAARWPTATLGRLVSCGAALSLSGLVFAIATTRSTLWDAVLACAMGMAAGSINQWVWARHAELVTTQTAAQQARGFAVLTASAQLALAAGSALIGLLLSACSHRVGAHHHLTWAMALGPIVCGTLCLLIACAAHGAAVFSGKSTTVPTRDLRNVID